MTRATIKEVAELADCSVMTVSNVINRRHSVRRENREKVLKAIERVGYQPSSWARQLARRRGGNNKAPITRRFGCLIDSSIGKYADPYYGEVLEALEKVLHANNFELSFIEQWSNVHGTERLGMLLNPESIDVLVLFQESVLREVKKYVRDIVVSGSWWEDRGNIDYVSFDAVGAAHNATQHLLDLGHRRIAYIGPSIPAEYIDREREGGYQQAMFEHPERPDPIIIKVSGSSTQEAYDQAMPLLAGTDRPTAFFAFNDPLAIGVLKAAREAGLTVPRDLSVVGFNDDHLATLVSPELTTVHVDKIGLGRMIAQCGVERLRTPDLPGRMVLLNTDLVVRQSTGPVPK